MSLFRRAIEHGRGWASAVTDTFHGNGTTVYQGGAPVAYGAGRQTINGVLPHIPEVWGYYDCLDAETAILTIDGWRSHAEVDAGTLVLALDVETGLSRWEPIQKVNRYEVENETMLSIEGQLHSSISTLNHRWPIQRDVCADGHKVGVRSAWSRSSTFKSNDRIRTAAPHASLPTEAKWSDALVETVAWFWTEGTIRKRSILIYQSETANPAYCARIRSALTALLGPPGVELWADAMAGRPAWREGVLDSSPIRRFRLNAIASELLLDIAPAKIVRLDFIRELTAAQLELFIRVSLMADGFIPRSVISQRDPKALEALELACILSGRTPHTYDCGTAPKTIMHLRDADSIVAREKYRSLATYSGTVWCPTTPSGTWMARRRGTVYFTGNSVGSFHFSAQFLAACLSRCTMRVGWLDIENKVGPAFDEKGNALDGVPVRLAKAGAKLIAGLRSAPGMTDGGPVGGHSMILGRIGANLLPVRECYLVATKTPMGDHWEVLSTVELVPAETPPGEKQRFKRRRHRNGPFEDFTPNFYLRIADHHPAHSGDADSGSLAVLSTLERLALLDAEGLADSKSRLKGPGVYWIASEADFPASDDDPDGDKYMQREFIKTAEIGIRDPASASRHVPLVGRAPLNVIKDGIRHDRFDYDSGDLIEKRAAAAGDLARGLPLPYEAVIGYSETSFANAFAIDDQLVRVFISPILDLITGCLTAGWFTQSLMRSAGLPLDAPPSEDIARLVVWYDVSGLVTDPDPTKVAMWAYGNATNPNDIIGPKGVRRLLGIPEGEAPTPELTAERIEQAQKLRARSEKGDNRPDTEPEDGEPEEDDGKRNDDEEVGKRVLALADVMVKMAVDQAGAKLRNKCAKRPDLLSHIDGVDAADVARVLGRDTVERLGGTGPLLNGSTSAFTRTVTGLFAEVGRDDAAELAATAARMVERAALARLSNPAARIDAAAAAEFLAMLNAG